MMPVIVGVSLNVPEGKRQGRCRWQAGCAVGWFAFEMSWAAGIIQKMDCSTPIVVPVLARMSWACSRRR